MKRKSQSAVLLVLLLVAALLVWLPGRAKQPLEWNGRVLLAVGLRRTPTNAGAEPTANPAPPDPGLLQERIAAASKVGADADFLHGVAVAAQAAPDAFAFRGIRPLRGAALLEASFAGTDSNVTARVAIAASHRLATNLMAVFTNTSVEVVDLSVSPARSRWWRR